MLAFSYPYKSEQLVYRAGTDIIQIFDENMEEAVSVSPSMLFAALRSQFKDNTGEFVLQSVTSLLSTTTKFYFALCDSRSQNLDQNVPWCLVPPGGENISIQKEREQEGGREGGRRHWIEN